jgi:hypothetical protein
MQIILSPGFYCMVKIRRRVGRALDHLLFTIEKKGLDMSVCPDTNLTVLVDGKADEIAKNILELSMSDDLWTDIIAYVASVFDDARAAAVQPALYRYVMQLVTAFHRRVILRMQSWQCRLLTLARADHTVCCQDRVALAKELLAFIGRLDELPLVARKVVLCFTQELRGIVTSNGQISMTLYTPFKMLRGCWRGDSQDHTNFIVGNRLLVNRAPPNFM